MKSNRFWLALLGLLLLGGCAVGFFFMGGEGHGATVTLDGQVIDEIDLDRVAGGYTFEVEGACRNTVEVEYGRIRVASADCPDQVCVGTGWIEDGTKPIVCLPGKLVIEITGGKSEIDITAK